MLLLLACKDGKESQTIDSPFQESVLESQAESQPDSTLESSLESSLESKEDSSLESVPDPPEYDFSQGFNLLETTPMEYSYAGWSVSTIEIASDFEVPITSVDGFAPRFRVVWPDTPENYSYPVLLYYHGGNIDVDTPEDPDGAANRCSLAYGIASGLGAATDNMLIHFAIENKTIVVIPENSFCDGFFGRGPEDPIDTKHAGLLLAELALGWLQYGQSHLKVDIEQLYGAGVSLGLASIVYFAATHPGMSGIVADSLAPDMVRYYYEEDYVSYSWSERQARYEHNFGGPPFESEETQVPTAAWPYYRDSGLLNALSAGTIDLPIFHVFSSEDPISGKAEQQQVKTLFEQIYMNQRWVSYDSNHTDPSHIQTQGFSSIFAAYAAARFLWGSEVELIEAEDFPGIIGQGLENDSKSGGRVWGAAPAESGLLVDAISSQSWSAGTELQVAVFMEVSGTTATVRLLEDGLEIASTTVGETTATDFQSFRAEFSSLSMVSQGGALGVQVESAGAGLVEVDLVVLDAR